MANEYGNYCTLNPNQTVATLANGNTSFSHGSSVNGGSTLKIASGDTNKYYWEAEVTTQSGSLHFGITDADNVVTAFTSGNNCLIVYAGGTAWDFYKNGSEITAGILPSVSDGDTVMWAFDPASRKVWVGENNTWVGDPVNGTGEATTLTASDAGWLIFFRVGNTSAGGFNFGATAFTHTQPSGFVALATQNLPTPTIINPAEHFFSTVIDHDGSSTDGTCTFNLDTYEWTVIIKNIDGASEKWYIINTLRGIGHYHTWDGGEQESDDTNVLSVSGTTFTLGSTLGDKSYLVEFHKAGLSSAKAANEEGDRNTVATSVNLISGFGMSEIVGTGSATNFGHGMDTAPEMVINANASINESKHVLHIGNNPDNRIDIGRSVAKGSGTTNNWGGAFPTPTLITIGTETRTNGDGNNIIFYYWHGVSGYSSFGSYEGNGVVDGPMINTGAHPASVLVKNIDSAQTWVWHHKATSPTNPNNLYLKPNETAIATDTQTAISTDGFDFNSNGFKVRAANAGWNTTTLIYSAWGGTPIQGDGGVNQGRAK